MTAIDVPVLREPLWIVMLLTQQRAPHVKARVDKLDMSISCFHGRLQQSKIPLLSPIARFWHGFGTVPARFRDPLELRNISDFLAQLGTQVPTDFRLNNNLSRTVSHETCCCKFESLRVNCPDLAD